ncbi:MAG: AAA family ATPase [Chloroflexi bacterium]|nr:AAA family ATPase [Chloroflexota bacterium]
METPVVGTLLDSLDQNKRFKLFAYYSINFGVLPSSLKLELPIEQSKETVDAIIESMDLGDLAFVPVFKNWVTEDFQNARQSEDYAFEYVFKSMSGHAIIHFAARESYLTVDFLYDVGRPETERWILETNHKLRSAFGKPKKPKFKVLMHEEGMFGTEDVGTNDFDSINIKELYNDDFIEIDTIISDFMTKQESGIVLLHGEPGTGKTTYIKHLICKFINKDFIFVQNDFVRDLLKPSFISFLLQNKNATLIIEDAEKVVVSRDHSSEDSVVSTILQLTDGLFSDFLNIKIICTFNTDIDRIDKALLRKGRMIAKYHFKPLSSEKTAALTKKLGHDDVTGSLTLADIFEYDKREFKNQSKRTIGFIPS